MNIKTNQLFLLFTTIFSTLSYTQNERYSLGVNLGYGLSNQMNTLVYGQDQSLQRIPVYNGDINIRMQLGQKGFYLESGIKWDGYGWENSITTNVYQTKLSFLTIPLIATYKFNKIIPGLTISAGPQTSFFSFQQWKRDNELMGSQWNQPNQIFSTFFALGYEHQIGKRWLLGGSVYNNLNFSNALYNIGLSINGRYILNHTLPDEQQVSSEREQRSVSAHLGYGVSNSLWYETDLKPTFNAGIELRRQINQGRTYLQYGIRWNEYGYSETFQSFIWNGEYYDIQKSENKSTSFFLTAPLIFTFKSDQGITFSTGPQLSFYLFSKSNYGNEINFHGGDYPLLNFGLYCSTGYEYQVNSRWIIGGEVYTNLNFPLSKWGYELNDHNFGLAVTGRYILNK